MTADVPLEQSGAETISVEADVKRRQRLERHAEVAARR